MTYEERMAMAGPHEDFVRTALLATGWDAEPFGQGQLSPHMRDHLRAYRDSETDSVTEMRWLPDILAAVRKDNRTYTRLVDAKAGRTDTPFHVVEARALTAGLRIQEAFRISVWYVFTDLGCIDATDLDAAKDKVFMVGNPGRTDYWLFPKTICRPFRDAFRIGPAPHVPAAGQIAS